MTAEPIDFSEHLLYAEQVGANVARKFNVRDMDDARQDAAIGMFEASTRYDPDRGVPFRAYALLRVRGSVVDGIRKRAWWGTSDATAAQPLGCIEEVEEYRLSSARTEFEDDLIDLIVREERREWILGHADILTSRQAEYLPHLMKAGTLEEVARRFGVTWLSIYAAEKRIIGTLRTLNRSRCQGCKSSYHPA